MLESLGLVSMHRSKASKNNEEEVENKLFLSPLLSHFLFCGTSCLFVSTFFISMTVLIFSLIETNVFCI